MTEPLVIRPSSLPAWNDCPRRTIARAQPQMIQSAGYDLRRPGNHVGANVGSGVHAGAAYTLQQKMETGGLGFDDEAFERARAEFDTRSEQEGVAWDGTTGDRNTAEKQLRRMVGSYRHVLAPELQPVLVEQRLEVEAGDGVVLSGQLDALIQEPRGRLRDLKTGTAMRANGAQYGAYSMIFRAHGHDIRDLIEDYVARVRLDKPQPEPSSHLIPLAAAEWDALAAIAEIKASVSEFQRRLKTGDAPPENAFRANPYSRLCSARFCPAWGTDWCKSHMGAQ